MTNLFKIPGYLVGFHDCRPQYRGSLLSLLYVRYSKAFSDHTHDKVIAFKVFSQTHARPGPGQKPVPAHKLSCAEE